MKICIFRINYLNTDTSLDFLCTCLSVCLFLFYLIIYPGYSRYNTIIDLTNIDNKNDGNENDNEMYLISSTLYL